MDTGENAMIWIRIGIGFIMLITSLEAWRISAILHNDRLFVLGKRIFYTLLVFGLLRIAASIVDGAVGWTFAWAATITTYVFWIAVYLFFRSHRQVLQKDVTPEDLAKISESFDEILESMRLVKVKLDEKIDRSGAPNA